MLIKVLEGFPLNSSYQRQDGQHLWGILGIQKLTVKEQKKVMFPRDYMKWERTLAQSPSHWFISPHNHQCGLGFLILSCVSFSTCKMGLRCPEDEVGQCAGSKWGCGRIQTTKGKIFHVEAVTKARTCLASSRTVLPNRNIIQDTSVTQIFLVATFKK